MVLTPAQRAEMAKAAVDAAEKIAAEALPTTRELEQLSLDELDALLRTRGVELDWERLETKIRATLGQDVVLLNRGVELDAARLAALEQKAKRAVVQTARAVANQTMGDLRQAAFDGADPRPRNQRSLMWVSVGEGACPSCKDRHGHVFRADYWEGDAPRDGTTICEDNCRCVLVPVPDPPEGDEGLNALD